MRTKLSAMFFIILVSCGEKQSPKITAQEIIDKSISVAGGDLYRSSRIQFDFRGNTYMSCLEGGKRVLVRYIVTDSARIEDRRAGDEFSRKVGASVQELADSTRSKLSNAVNSVHYFAYLPYGLNGSAVHKELLGTTTLRNKEYYKIRVTFSEAGGGEDYEDVFIYWINSESYRPDYLAYLYHTNGGGIRFREAFNDRQIGGISFVDYRNYKPSDSVDLVFLDQLFEAGKLEEISQIVLENVSVTSGNCN